MNLFYKNMQTLKELFIDWVEPEEAMGYLACHIGIISYEGDIKDYFSKNKIDIFHSNNKTSILLYNMLEQMVEIGFLEKDDDWAYRWDNSFIGFWEGGNGGGY